MNVKIQTRLRTTMIKALTESMDSRTMLHIIRELLPDYDIHARTGYPESLSIPNQEVAQQIVKDVLGSNKFLPFVALLIEVQETGYMGRKYPIAHLRDILRAVYEFGFIYDTVNRLFVEDQNSRCTRNWSVLVPGIEYTIAFMAIDIVGNSKLVKRYSADTVQRTYHDLKEMVSSISMKRNGRIWNWEGDGGLAAFFFGNKHMSAVLCGMELLHELFLYNRTSCPLDEPLRIRIGIHGGPCEYTDNEEELKEIQTVRETVALEQKADSNESVISIVIKVMLDEIISRKFVAKSSSKNGPFGYSLEFE